MTHANRTWRALVVRDAMVAALAKAETLAQLDALYVDWVGYSRVEDDAQPQTVESLRGDLQDYIRELCYAEGIPCPSFDAQPGDYLLPGV